MRKVSFLLILFFFTRLAFPYTVVLKSGRQLQGDWIGEDDVSIQVKDSAGVALSFKKANLDLWQMETLNKCSGQSCQKQVVARQLTTITRPQSFDQDNPLPGLAEQTRNSRTGRARVFSQADLATAPELSIIGTTEPVKSPKISESSSRKEERYWRQTAASLRRELSRVAEKKNSADAACSRARDNNFGKQLKSHRAVIDMSELNREPVECDHAREVARDFEAARLRYDDFLERARKESIPSAWVE